jgi:hypothetical protein
MRRSPSFPCQDSECDLEYHILTFGAWLTFTRLKRVHLAADLPQANARATSGSRLSSFEDWRLPHITSHHHHNQNTSESPDQTRPCYRLQHGACP